MKLILESQRLVLREMIPDDQPELMKVLGNVDSMRYYPAPFSVEKVKEWIASNIANYQQYQHGLWAVIRKEDNTFLGDCGITMQNIEGTLLPEIGYHIRPDFCGNGYATEAARACLDDAFNTLNYSLIISYMHCKNLPSMRVAQKTGMQFVRYFEKIVMGEWVREALYQIKKEDYHSLPQP